MSVLLGEQTWGPADVQTERQQQSQGHGDVPKDRETETQGGVAMTQG